MARAYYPRALAALGVLLDGESTVHHYLVVPRELEVERNHHREADSFKLDLDYWDFPLDPRAVRSIHVTLFLGDVGRPNTELSRDDERYRVFVGYADEPETTLDEAGEKVSLQGRDYTSLFLDYRWPGTAIAVDKTLTKVIRAIVAQVPGAEGISLDFRGGSGDSIPAEVLGKTKYSPGADDDAWTIIVELCGLNGLVPVIELDTLVVRTPNEVQQRSARFLYGRDVSRLAFRRNFLEARSAQVQVNAWDAENAITQVALYPPRPIITKQKVSTAGKVSTETAPLIPWFIQGKYTPDQLSAIAEMIYENLAREQVDGDFDTREMRDSAGVELWRLANGDRVQIGLGKSDLSSIQGMSDAEAIAVLTSGPRPFDEGVARALIAGARRAEKLSSRFYVRQARHRWSRSDGYQLDVSFINYVGVGG